MSEDRRGGFYWVIPKYQSLLPGYACGWTIGWFDGRGWLIPGIQGSWADDDLALIDERRLVRVERSNESSGSQVSSER